MKDSEVVAAAREKIADQKSWVRGDWCVGTKEDVKMCAEGAIQHTLKLWYYDTRSRGWRRRGFSTESLQDRHSQADRIQKEMAKVALDMFSDGKGTPQNRVKFDRSLPWALNEFNDASEDAGLVKVIHHEDIMAIFDKTLAKYQEEGR